MLLEVGQPLEGLLADATLVGPDAHVHPVLPDKVRHPGEAAVAAGTQDEVVAGVPALVHRQEHLVGEGFQALIACVHHFSR